MKTRGSQRKPVSRRPPERSRHGRLVVLLLFVLLAGMGVWKMTSRLQRQTLRLQAAEESNVAAQSIPAEGQLAVGEEWLQQLRGTMYDGNMKELAVSYQLFSLLVHPAKLIDLYGVSEQLAKILGTDGASIRQRLQSEESVVELAGGLDASQAAAAALQQPGIYSKSIEVRYYPGHAAGGHLIGFASDGSGLSGFEALYDPVLQPGGFRSIDVPEVDCDGHETLGRSSADIVLSLDLDLQQQLEQLLLEYRTKKGAASGSMAVMDPETGRMLALVKQPGFDPNYFWQVDEQREEGPFSAADFFPELIRPLLTEAAAIYDAGIGGSVLPVFVSAPDHGLTGEQLDRYWRQFGLDQSVQVFLPNDPLQTAAAVGEAERAGRLSTLQIVVGAATMLNNGRRVEPWFLKAIYDHEQQRFFVRDLAAIRRRRVLLPAAGVNLRRQLLDKSGHSKQGFLFVSGCSATTERKGLSEHHVQELLLAATPKDDPKLLLMMALDYGRLQPYQEEEDGQSLEEFGRSLLARLAGYEDHGDDKMIEVPPERNEANLRRFLLSRRLNSPAEEEKGENAALPVMPQVTGLSLRKGLQRLSQHRLKVRIRGSGRIVAQQPAAGTTLARTESCELILEPLLKNERVAQDRTPSAAKLSSPRIGGEDAVRSTRR